MKFSINSFVICSSLALRDKFEQKGKAADVNEKDSDEPKAKIKTSEKLAATRGKFEQKAAAAADGQIKAKSALKMAKASP
jgi:hypothetical protein